MKKLILIRHSEPEVEPGVPANRWRLSARGRDRCVGLAQRLAAHRPAIVLTSIEPKARETGEMVADRLRIPSYVLEGLHEHERKTAPYVGEPEFKDAVGEMFARPGELVYGEETADQARERFESAIRAALEDRQDADVAIVAHGTVISLFVAAVTGVDGLTLWQSIGMPSYMVLSRQSLSSWRSSRASDTATGVSGRPQY